MRGKIIALSAAFSLAAGIAAAQDKTFDLKLAHWVPPSHPLQKALEDWGASVETQVPIYGIPKDFDMRLAFFADAGSVWGYTGPTFFPATGTSVTTIARNPVTGATVGADTNDMIIRSSVGAGIIWESPFGPIRIDYSFPLTKDPNDRTQQLRFSGGTRF